MKMKIGNLQIRQVYFWTTLFRIKGVLINILAPINNCSRVQGKLSCSQDYLSRDPVDIDFKNVLSKTN